MSRISSPIAALVAIWMSFCCTQICSGFHEGGENYCQGCHIIHDAGSGPGAGIHEPPGPEPSNVRLIGSDPSSTCLRCHAFRSEAGIVLTNDGSSFTAGGDFYWLKKTFGWYESGRYMQSEADRHGHNIVAVDYEFYQDRTRPTSPGGGYPSTELGCHSCHDPHGKANKNSPSTEPPSTSGTPDDEAAGISGTYRLLAGSGYRKGRNIAVPAFKYGAPVAMAGSGKWEESDVHHPAYGSGLSQWCGNCHSDYFDGHTIEGRRKHPVGKDASFSDEIAGNYNSYLKSGDFRGGQAGAYLSLIPFETGITDARLLTPDSSAGPNRAANVMCLTCHRAHASAFEDIGRWDFKARFIADAHPRQGDIGVTGNDVLNSYYGKNMPAAYGQTQRQFCNKCHLKD